MILNKEQFKQELAKIKEVRSVTGNSSYRSIALNGEYVEFIREGKPAPEIQHIIFDELYKLYCYSPTCCTTTTKARDYITGRVYSPAVAIIAKIIGC